MLWIKKTIILANKGIVIWIYPFLCELTFQTYRMYTKTNGILLKDLIIRNILYQFINLWEFISEGKVLV